MPVVPSIALSSKSKNKNPPCRPKRKKSSVGKWRVVGNMLIPKKQALLEYCTKLSSLPPADPIITFHFPSTTRTVQVHKSRLTIAGGPLRALVNNGFAESNQSDITLSDADDVEVFSVVTAFLYLKRIDLSVSGSIDLALAAHRWQLNDLFNAYFVHARTTHAASCVDGLRKFFPLLRRIDVPQRFRVYLAVNIALNFKEILTDLGILRKEADKEVETSAVVQETSATDRRRSERLRHKTQERDEAALKRPRVRQVPASNGAGPSSAGARSTMTRVAKRPSEIPLTLLGRELRKRNKGLQNNLQQVADLSMQDSDGLPPERDESFWVMLQSQGMLAHVIRYVCRYSKEDYSSLFLDVVMRELEPALTDNQVVQLLHQLDWSSNGHAEAIKKPEVEVYSGRAFRLLAVAQSGILSRGDGITEMKLSWTFKKVPQLVRDRSNMLVKSDPFPYNAHKFIMSLACSDCSATYLAPLIVRIILNHTGGVSNVPKNIMVMVRVRAIESGCGCDATPLSGKRSYRGISGRRAHNSADRNIMLRAFTEGSGEPFVLLDSSEFRNWLNQHELGCSLLVQAHLRFRTLDSDAQAQRKRNDFGLNAQHRALMRSQLAGNGRRNGLSHDPSHDCSDSDSSSDASSDSSISMDADMESDAPFLDLSDDDSLHFLSDY